MMTGRSAVLPCWLLATTLSAPSLAEEPPAPSVLVLPTQGLTLGPGTSDALTQMLVATVSRLGDRRVVSTRDLEAALSAERLKDTLGCNDVECASEIGGALGVQSLLTTSAEKVGQEILVTATLLDAESAVVQERRTLRLSPEEETWLEGVVALVADIWDHDDRTALMPESLQFHRRHSVRAVFLWDHGAWDDPQGDYLGGEQATSLLAGAEYAWQHAPWLSLTVTLAGGSTQPYYGREGTTTGAFYASLTEEAAWSVVSDPEDSWPGCGPALVAPYVRLGVDYLYGVSDGYGSGGLHLFGGVTELGVRLFWLQLAVRGGLLGSLTDGGNNRRAAHVGASAGLAWMF